MIIKTHQRHKAVETKSFACCTQGFGTEEDHGPIVFFFVLTVDMTWSVLDYATLGPCHAKNALFYFAGDGCGRRRAAEVGGVFGESRCYRVETWMLVCGKLIRKKGPQFPSWGGRADGWLEELICSHSARKHDCSFIVLHKQMQQNK